MAVPSVKIRVTSNVPQIKQSIVKAVDKGVQQSTFLWEAEAKQLFTVEDHVVTGRARGSINASKATPPNYREGGFSPETDGIHQKTREWLWQSGSNVEYMPELEKRYSIFARALDGVRGSMADIIDQSVTEVL